MKPDQINKAIAELCGWTKDNDFTVGHGGNRPWSHPDYGNSLLIYDDWNLPDYCNDLNAMHDAEKVLLTLDANAAHWETYSNRLVAQMGCTDLFHATAAQRAEAFLRTLGKWEDTE